MIEPRNSCSRILGRSVVIAWGIVLLIGQFGSRLEAVENAGSASPGTAPDVAPTPPILLGKWEEYLSQFGEVACEHRERTFGGLSLESLKESETTYEFGTAIAAKEGCAFVGTLRPARINEASAIDVEALNDKYAFHLRRKASEEVDLYELDAETPIDVFRMDSDGFYLVRGMTKGAFATFAPRLLLPDVLRHPSFELRSVSKTPEGDWQLLFDCEIEAYLEWFFHGPVRLIVQSDGFHLPRSLSGRVRTPIARTEVLVDNEYAESLGLPRMSSFRLRRTGIQNKKRFARETVCQVTWRRPTDEDRSMLYLSHYGLPEPKVPGRMNWWYAVGGLLILLGAYRMYLGRERPAAR